MGFQVVGVLGSPLARGNTARLLDQALSGAHDAGCDVERIDITTMTISPCREIFYCREHETCAMKDDMIPMYRKFSELDSLVVATPVMTMGIPGRSSRSSIGSRSFHGEVQEGEIARS